MMSETVLSDRSSFMRRMETSLGLETVSLAVVDIDDFGEVNSQHGRDSADALLVALGQRLETLAAEQGGFAARTGGDEFAVALIGKSLEAAFLLMEDLRRDAGPLFRSTLGESSDKLVPTISVGVANYPRDALTAADLAKRTDQAIWQAKEGGRNQVALPAPEDMVLKSNYYTPSQLGRLKKLAESRKQKESILLREALDELLRKYDLE